MSTYKYCAHCGERLLLSEIYCPECDCEEFVNTKPLVKDGFRFTPNGDGTYSVEQNCDDLVSEKEITVPSEYEGKPVTRIADSAFSMLIYLEKITIPNSITEIESGAFLGCDSLKGVSIPNRESISDLHPTNSY